MKLVKGNVTIGVQTRFGPNWPGIRCLAKTRRGTECQSAAYKDKLAAQRHAAKVGRRVRGELKRIERQIVDAGLMPDE
jgi:hypothetical protein